MALERPAERFDPEHFRILEDIRDTLGDEVALLDIGAERARTVYEGLLQGEDNPDLSLDVSIERVDEGLAVIDESIRQLDVRSDHVLGSAYLAAAREYRSRLATVGAAITQNPKAFLRESTVAYGKLDYEMAAGTKAFLFDAAGQVIDRRGDKHPASIAAQRVQERLARIRGLKMGAAKDVMISPEVHARAKEHHADFIHSVLGELIIPEVVTYELRRDVLIPEIKSNLGIPDGMYTHELSNNGSATWRIVHKGAGAIMDPGRQSNDISFKGVVALHELGVHVSERISAMRGAVGLLEIGFAGSRRSGEGKGVMNETFAYPSLDAFYESARFNTILMRYLMPAAPNFCPNLSFGDLWRLNRDIKSMRLLHSQGDNAMSVQEAYEQTGRAAANEVRRNYRGGVIGPNGMHLPHPGSSMYLPGLLAQTRVAAAMPNYADYAYRGKYDITEPSNVQPLQQLGVLPKQLVE